jgi:hypothetical protein
MEHHTMIDDVRIRKIAVEYYFFNPIIFSLNETLRATKTALTGAKTNIDRAYTNIETMEQEIRNCITELTELLKTPTNHSKN